MMRSLMTLAFMALLFVSNGQVLFRYGTNAVSKDEFWRAYTKNNTGVSTSTGIRDYLDLYIKFKLKVKAARDQKLDTLASIKNDVAGFRAQMAEQYLQKLPYRREMITEAAERSKTRIEVSHIFIDYNGDTATAKQEIDKAYAQLQSGADFSVTARNASNEPYVKAKDGYVGYISVFSLPYELENVVYGLKKGTYSKPVAGKKGWHIFKVTDIQSNTSFIKAAQIFLAVPADASQEERSFIKQKADSLYGILLGGSDFSTVAQQNSQDKFTYQNGGVLPNFNFTEYDPAFTKAVFALKKEGDIAPPVETSAGWHIVKLLGNETVIPDISNAETYEEWNQKVNQDDRYKLVTAKEKEAVKTASGYKSVANNQNDLWALTDSMLAATDYVAYYKKYKQNKLFQLTDKTVTYTDWFKFIKDKKTSKGDQALDGYNELMQEFTESTVTQYYKDHLEDINPDFRFQMQEFFEGSLLFEVMERNVWSKAPTDSIGLQNFYTPRKDQYIWKKSVSAVIFNCADTANANKIWADMKKDPLQWKAYMDGANGYALADSSRFEVNQLPVDEKASLQKDWLSPITINDNDGSSSFCYITALHADNQVRSFEEAKGLVINDYQLFLEEKWLAEQKKKYPVKIEEAVLKSLK